MQKNLWFAMTQPHARRLTLFATAALFRLAIPAHAQSTVAHSGFQPAGRQLVLLDFSTFPLGPLSMQDLQRVGMFNLKGELEIVLKDGVRMLRAAEPSTFRVRLPEALPNDFTLEFDLIPKNCCAPQDLSFEGTAEIRQDEVSAHVYWHRDYLQIVGGVKNQSYDKPMPPALSAVLPGTLANIAVSMQGSTLRMFTNGQPIYSLERAFARGRVLRVFLGGQKDGRDDPVYLARLRLAVGPPVTAASGSGPSTLNQTSNPVPNVNSGGNSASSTSGLGTTLVQNVTVTLGTSGPIVNWQHGTAPATYTVQRWKADDPNCCSNASPASPPLTGPPWQDSPPPLSGTYTYRVTATSKDGSAMAGTDFVYTRGTTRGTIIADAPARASVTPPFAVTVTMGTSGPVVTWPAVSQAEGYRASRSHIDDLNCCNTASGARTFTATSPWQDQPLPKSGTYLYQVVANTPNGQVVAETHFTFRKPGEETAAPVPMTALPAAPPTGTAIVTPDPGTLGSPPPRNPSPTPSTAGTGPAVDAVVPDITPVAVVLHWQAVTGAVGYRVRRAQDGTMTWIDLTPSPITTLHSPVDVFPDRNLKYVYEVRAYQADGTYGAKTVVVAPSAPRDPHGFTAMVVGPGEVRFSFEPEKGFTAGTPEPNGNPAYWGRVFDVLIAGPGTGNGLRTVPAGLGTVKQYTLKGVPPGTHTWTIATIYEPGGVLTPSSAWPTATATIAAPDPAPRYRLVALGIRADRQSRDVNDPRDGVGDEVYLTALVNQTTLTGLPLPVVKEANLTLAMTKSHGSEAVSVPYGRIKAGTASAYGGIKTGDVVPATLDVVGPTPATLHNDRFPLQLWEGSLEDNAVVVVHPALWEDDVDPRVQANWAMLLTNEARASYSPQADTRTTDWYVVDTRTYSTYKRIFTLSGQDPLASGPQLFYDNEPGPGDYIANGSELFQCTTILGVWVRRPCEAHGVDRPIGLWGSGHPGNWSDLPIVVTKAGAERLLADRTEYVGRESLGPGTFTVWLHDRVGEPAVTEAIAKYRLYLRLERVP